eukprot:TRINITY_DN27693_c0_g1_i3.p1 TRINITY_DN27693_c0_g1~~TRINITY_DN27693_c0_g1_i3.p1  ORF type:complete len:687 (+),score=149.83 TRINITY_DN27693_c0_g1_i3:1209-3269(+)
MAWERQRWQAGRPNWTRADLMWENHPTSHRTSSPEGCQRQQLLRLARISLKASVAAVRPHASCLRLRTLALAKWQAKQQVLALTWTQFRSRVCSKQATNSADLAKHRRKMHAVLHKSGPCQSHSIAPVQKRHQTRETSVIQTRRCILLRVVRHSGATVDRCPLPNRGTDSGHQEQGVFAADSALWSGRPDGNAATTGTDVFDDMLSIAFPPQTVHSEAAKQDAQLAHEAGRRDEAAVAVSAAGQLTMMQTPMGREESERQPADSMKARGSEAAASVATANTLAKKAKVSRWDMPPPPPLAKESLERSSEQGVGESDALDAKRLVADVDVLDGRKIPGASDDSMTKAEQFGSPGESLLDGKSDTAASLLQDIKATGSGHRNEARVPFASPQTARPGRRLVSSGTRSTAAASSGAKAAEALIGTGSQAAAVSAHASQSGEDASGRLPQHTLVKEDCKNAPELQGVVAVAADQAGADLADMLWTCGSAEKASDVAELASGCAKDHTAEAPAALSGQEDAENDDGAESVETPAPTINLPASPTVDGTTFAEEQASEVLGAIKDDTDERASKRQKSIASGQVQSVCHGPRAADALEEHEKAAAQRPMAAAESEVFDGPALWPTAEEIAADQAEAAKAMLSRGCFTPEKPVRQRSSRKTVWKQQPAVFEPLAKDEWWLWDRVLGSECYDFAH